MSMRTAGDLCAFTVFDETAYGTTATATGEHAGVLQSLETPDDEQIEYDLACGSRAIQNVLPTMNTYGWKASFKVISGTDWHGWFTKAMGDIDGDILNDIPSFTALFRIASDEWLEAVGSKVNSLSVTASAIGSPLEFSVDAMSKTNTFKASTTLTPVARPTSKPVTYSALWKRNGSSIPVKSWTLSIDNSLVGDPGVGTDGIGLAAGSGSAPGGAIDMTLELTVSSTGPTWDLLKQAGTANDTLTLAVDGYIITCTGCFMRTDYPNRSNSPYDETIAYIVKGITVEADSP